ncbi:MAG: hypothetical protein J7L42_06195 [Elusimicrobia bacterium]|nr:hypothetical protein [Elusimicrobiota bacterium]
MEGRSKILRFLIFFILFTGCTKPKKYVFQFEQQMQDLTIERIKKGKLLTQIKAEKLTKAKKTFLKNCQGVFYKATSKVFFRAKEVYLTEDLTRILFMTDVYIEDQRTLEEWFIKKVKWNPQKKVYFSDYEVRKKTPTGEVTGTGFVADENFEWIEIKNPRVFEKIKG